MISALSPLSPAESTREPFPGPQKSSPDGADFLSLLAYSPRGESDSARSPNSQDRLESSPHSDPIAMREKDRPAETFDRDESDASIEKERATERKPDGESAAEREEPGRSSTTDADGILSLLLQKSIQADGRMAPARVEKADIGSISKEEKAKAEKAKKDGVHPAAGEALAVSTSAKMNPEARIAGRDAMGADTSPQKSADPRVVALAQSMGRTIHTAESAGSGQAEKNAPKNLAAKGLALESKEGSGKTEGKDETPALKKKERAKGKFESLAPVANQPEVPVLPKTADAQASGEKPVSNAEATKTDRGDLAATGFKTNLPGAAKAGEIAQLRMPNPTEFIQTVSGQIRMAVAEGRETLTVKLQPENLGKMTITLGRDEGGILTGRLTVETEAVKQLLESHLSDLKDRLDHAGFRFQDLDVDVKSGTSGERGAQAEREDAKDSPSSLAESRETESAWSRVDFRYSDRLVNVLA